MSEGRVITLGDLGQEFTGSLRIRAAHGPSAGDPYNMKPIIEFKRHWPSVENAWSLWLYNNKNMILCAEQSPSPGYFAVTGEFPWGGQALHVKTNGSKVGCGTNLPGSRWSVNGEATIGGYTFTQLLAPPFGLAIENNLGIGTVDEFGGGQGCIAMKNADVVPSAPAGGSGIGILYVTGGALRYRGELNDNEIAPA